MEYTTFSFETAKEFSSFRYEIAVRYKLEPGTIVFRVLGMTATRMMMPSFGTAKSVLKVPHLPYGAYMVTFIKSDGSENQFMMEFTKKGMQILKPIPRKRFIDLIIDPHAALPGGKILTTVTKITAEPLIPRTIQKRLPVPPTPEELAILESLKTETPEERDAREEMELFGGKKRLSKKELAESEKELRKLGDKPTAAAKKTNGTKTKKAAAAKNGAKSKSNGKSAPKKAAKPVKKKAAPKPKAKPAKKAKKKK
ncbi:MAG: hypothetical protein Q8916_07285 [Bacteroidota bacterium]|nr:hypothetical protein [Bacteroidota bacterium]